jgi:tetratricopeptide (TPR) repeat protein
MLAARQPLVFILEDLHWADEMSVRLLGHLSRRLQDLPLLFVLTARTDEAEAPVLTRWLDAQEREPHVLRLAPLSHHETVTLVGMLAPASMPATMRVHVAEQIWRISEGNPFVVVETMRALPEASILAAPTGVSLPSCVRESIARRLTGLTRNARLLADVAAVVGRYFDFHLLPRAAALSEAMTAEGLEELVRRHILQAKGDSFAFVHDRIREVAYARLLAPSRKLLHGAVGEALETLYATNLEPHCVALGFHYSQAEVWPKAIAFLRRAGRAASVHSAYREATACFEQALLCAGHLPDEGETTALMIDLRLDLYQPLLSLGELAKLSETLHDAEARAKALNDQSRLGRVWSGQCQYFRLVGDPGRAIEKGQLAVATAQTLGDPELEVNTSYRLAQAHRSRGNYREAARLLIRNIDLLETEELGTTSPVLAEIAVLSRIQFAFCCAELGEISSAIVAGEESLGRAEAMDRVDLVAGARCGLGIAYLTKGEFNTASAMLEECVRLSRLYDLRVWRAWAEPPLGQAYTLAGRVAAAVVRLERAVKHAAFLNHSQAIRVTNLGQAYLQYGRLTDAREAVHRALSLARQHEEKGHAAWAMRLLGEIDSRSDPPDRDAAKMNYHRALEQADELGMRPLAARCHLGLGTLYREINDQQNSARHLTMALSLFREMGMESWMIQVEQLLKLSWLPEDPGPPPQADRLIVRR